MARPGSSYMQEAPPGYRWKTVTKINAMGRPYTTRILVPIDTLEPTQPTQVPQPQTAAGIFEDSGYGEIVTDQFPGGYPGQATTPQPATPPDWRDSFVGRAPPMAKKKDITTVIKKSEDPGVATTETITIKGGLMGEPEEAFQATPPPQPPSWEGSAAFADRDVGMGAGRIQLGDPRNVRAGPDLPPGYAPNPAYAPPGSSPSMNVDWSKIRASQRPGHIPPVNPYDFVGVPGGGQKVPGKLDLGLPPQFQSAVEEQALTGFPPIQKQIKPEDPASIATGPTDAMIEERFRRETAMIPDNERFVGGRVPPVSGIGTRTDPLPREIGGEGDVGRIDIRQPGQELPREVTEGGRGSFPEPTAKESKAADNAKMAANPNLEKVWGKFAYDPAARKKYFLDGMKDIYKKAMLLNLIAVMTGGESQAAAFIEAKTAELKMVDKFDEEERITNIWKEVFTDANGNPYMPKDKREAAERAGRTGARPEVIKDIFGAVPEAKAKQQYHRVDPKDPTKWEHRRFPAGEDVPDEWVSGKAGSKSPAEGDRASLEALKYLQKLENENSPYADEYANIINARRAGKQVATGTGVSFFNKMIEEGTYTLPEGENNFSILQKFLSLPEVTLMQETADGLVEVVVPGWSTITGQTPSKIEIAEATGGAEETTERVDARTRAQQLKAEGKTKEEAKRIMREEGYDIG